MNDYEYTFNQDIKEKKEAARGAFHKKNGSKSKKVTLPHDGISRKAWEGMNGPVKTIQMNAPMTWEQFKELDNRLQETYLNNLITKYSASTIEIADMLGTKKGTLRSHILRYGLKVKFLKGYRAFNRDPEKVASFQRFVNGAENEESTETEMVEAETQNDIEEETEFSHKTWEEFKSMDISHQREYIKYLRNTYGVGLTSIAQSMGVSREELYSHCVDNVMEDILRGKTSPTDEQARAFKEFIDEKTDERSFIEHVTSLTMHFDAGTNIELIAEAIRTLTGDTLKGDLEITFKA